MIFQVLERNLNSLNLSKHLHCVLPKKPLVFFDFLWNKTIENGVNAVYITQQECM